MTPASHIALRFTVSRKRSLALSLVGVIFGVAFFILTQAQTQGFEQYFIQTILGTSGAIVISDRFQSRYTSFADGKGERVNDDMMRSRGRGRRKYYEGITNAPTKSCGWRASFPTSAACAPIVQGTVAIRSNYTSEVLNVQGIDLDAQLAATALRSQIISGKIEDFRSSRAGIILGSLLADKLQVTVGDTVQLTGARSEAAHLHGLGHLSQR